LSAHRIDSQSFWGCWNITAYQLCFHVCDYSDLKLANCILFVDQSDFCRQYLAGCAWIERYTTAIEVDQRIINHFKIDQVPLWVWFDRGSEIMRGAGTVSESHIIEAVAQARWSL